MSTDLRSQRCQACEGDIAPLSVQEREQWREQISDKWSLNESQTQLVANFQFRNYYQTIAFVNALAWVAHQQNHHPDLSVSYRDCEVVWTTHAAQGLTLNDYICAAQTDALIEEKFA